jgi:SAM-dependent methyltransferase
VNRDEYGRMRAVEDVHWWYRGLRALVWHMWAAQPDKPAGLLLDIGCGTGGTLANAPMRGVGCDFSSDALRFCRERGQTALTRSDASSLPFRDASFTGALLLDVLYHRAVGDPAKVLREARRVLEPGGLLIVNVPAYEWLRSSHDAAIHTERRFTRAELHALLVSSGFRVEHATYWNTILFPAAAAVRLLRKAATRDTSDLADYESGPVTRLLAGALALERGVLRVMDLPFGLSVIAVARAQ